MTAALDNVLAWLPSYFLVVAKSVAEGFLQDYMPKKATHDAAIEAALKAREISGRKKKTRKKVVEQVSQELARGDFSLASDVIDLSASGALLVEDLKRFNDHRNQLAHRLGASGAKPVIAKNELEHALGVYKNLIALLPQP